MDKQNKENILLKFCMTRGASAHSQTRRVGQDLDLK